MEEVWKEIPDYPDYKVSNFGNIMSCKYNKEKLLKPYSNKKNYLCVSLRKNNKQSNIKVHRLIAIAFIPNPDNLPTVDHIDQNRKNNNLTNLRWATQYTQSMNRTNTRTDIDETDPKKRALIRSNESHQRSVDEKRFYCNTCNKAFHNNFTLQEHYTSPIHLRIINFKPTTKHFCRECGVSCRDKHGLTRHLNTPSHKKRMENK